MVIMADAMVGEGEGARGVGGGLSLVCDRKAVVAEVDPDSGEVRWRTELASPRTSRFRSPFMAPCDRFEHTGRFVGPMHHEPVSFMPPRFLLLLPLVLAACAGDEPSDGPTNNPTPTEVPQPTASTGDTHTGGPPTTSPPTASVAVSTRADLAPWLGFDIALDGVDEAWLECDSDTDPDERHGRLVGSGSTSLPGVLADHPFTCRLVVDHDGTLLELWSESVTTPPLPAGLPDLVLSTGGGEVASGWVVFDHWDQGSTRRALVVDGQGRIRWHRATDATAGASVIGWNGEHIFGAGGFTMPPTLYDLDGNVIFRGEDLPEPDYYHHEARWVDVDGTPGILTLVAREVPKAFQTVSPQIGFQAQVMDPVTGDRIWSWDVIDHLDEWGPPAPEGDPWHANAFTWEPDGSSWISARALNLLARIDRSTGRVTDVLGANGTVALFDATGSRLPPSSWFIGQHAPHVEGNRLFVMDNGRLARGYSRAVEYELDLDNDRAMEVWSWTEPGWMEPYYGSVSLLPGGNVLVASGHCNRCDGSGGMARKGFVAEIDHGSGEVLWRMDLGSHLDSLYRADFVPACDLFHHVGLCP